MENNMSDLQKLELRRERRRHEIEAKENAEFQDSPTRFLRNKCNKLEARVSDLEELVVQLIPIVQKLSNQKITLSST